MITRPFVEALTAQGFSIAPARNKRPAIDTWRALQQTPAPAAQVAAWFDAGAFAEGIGVISGPGGLMVLDFDTPAALEAFTRYAPALADVDTYRETTPRGGQHWIFRVAGDVPPVRTIDGGELRAVGAFTVIAPTPGYQVISGSWGNLHTLTANELAMVTAYFDDCNEGRDAPTSTLLAIYQKGDASSYSLIDAGDLMHLYNHQRQRDGRNNALFAVAVLGRDLGFSQSSVALALIDPFTHDPARPGHQHETAAARRAEGLRTIASAYSQPARRSTPRTGAPGLPNAIRERLMLRSDERDPDSGRRLPDIDGGAQLARMLDYLLIAGVRPGVELTERAAVDHLRGRMNRKPIRAAFTALKAVLNGVFSTHTPTARENRQPRNSSTNMRLLGGKLGVSVERLNGRFAPHVVKLPTFDALAYLLGLPTKRYAGDVPDDITSAKTWRRSLHAALIRRRPGQYTVRFLADRLGVCARTLRTYNRELGELLGLIVRAVTTATPLDARSIPGCIPDDPALLGMGVWLESNGRRYPPRRDIAYKLLRAGVRLVRQISNYYRIGEIPIWA